MSVFSNWTVGRRLVAGFGLSALTLVLVAVVSYRNAYLLIENDAWVAHSHQVRIELADLLSELKDAETGQRGYLLTGDDNYLEPYTSSLGALQTTLAELRKITSDNPEQQRRLTELSQQYQCGEVRGRGLLRALNLQSEIGPQVVELARHRGLLINAPRTDTLRFMPALTVMRQEIDRMIAILGEVLKEFLP